jgi:hypothetical protein
VPLACCDPVGDDERLAAAVERLLREADLRARLVETAGWKLQGFTRQATALATLREYQAVLSESGGAAKVNKV